MHQMPCTTFSSKTWSRISRSRRWKTLFGSCAPTPACACSFPCARRSPCRTVFNRNSPRSCKTPRAAPQKTAEFTFPKTFSPSRRRISPPAAQQRFLPSPRRLKKPPCCPSTPVCRIPKAGRKRAAKRAFSFPSAKAMSLVSPSRLRLRKKSRMRSSSVT